MITVCGAFVAGSVFADDAPALPPAGADHGYKEVKVDGRIIRVQESEPYRHAKSSSVSDGKYHPNSLDFSAASSMGDKHFDFSSGGKWSKTLDLKQQAAFPTTNYRFNSAAPSAPNLGTKAQFRTASFGGAAPASIVKKYDGLNGDAAQKQIAQGLTASSEQSRASSLAGQNFSAGGDAFAKKSFNGSEMDALHRVLSTTQDGKLMVTDLPTRPLSIDEVRDLINHGFKPNTDASAPEASKALNDPQHVPEPLREDPPDGTTQAPRARPVDDDKDDAVPSPGSIAEPPPENSDSLPKR